MTVRLNGTLTAQGLTDETIRSLAHDALTKIDPRKGLMGAEKG